METDYYFGGNGTGVIISSRGKCDGAGNQTGVWIDRIKNTSIRDGVSNTILAGELHIPPDEINKQPYNGAIFNGEDLAAHTRVGGPGVPLLSPRQQSGPVFGFGSWHPGICNFVMADGSTHSISVTVDTILLGDLCHRSDGNVAPWKN